MENEELLKDQRVLVQKVESAIHASLPVSYDRASKAMTRQSTGRDVHDPDLICVPASWLQAGLLTRTISWPTTAQIATDLNMQHRKTATGIDDSRATYMPTGMSPTISNCRLSPADLTRHGIVPFRRSRHQGRALSRASFLVMPQKATR